MSDLLRSLQGKPEVFGRRGFPRLNAFFTRHAVKRVIDLNTIQSAGIMSEKLLFRQSFGIEHRTPFFVAEARSAKPDPRHSGIMAYRKAEQPMNIARDRRDKANFAKNGRFSADFAVAFQQCLCC